MQIIFFILSKKRSELSEIIMEINDLREFDRRCFRRWQSRVEEKRPNAIAAKGTQGTQGTQGTDKSASLAGPGFTLIDSLMIHHGDDFTPNGKKRKTYGRLLGMIFL
jgi:hypothetical protein